MNTEKMEERLLGERLQELEEGELAEAIEAAIEDETKLTEERLLDDVLREASSCSKLWNAECDKKHEELIWETYKATRAARRLICFPYQFFMFLSSKIDFWRSFLSSLLNVRG